MSTHDDDQRIAHHVAAYNLGAASYDPSRPEIFNAVEQERLAGAVREVLVAADVSVESLRVLRENVDHTGRLETQLLDGRSLAVLADESFDVAACYSVPHHVPADVGPAAEMARVVRQEGLDYLDHERHDARWLSDPVRDQFFAEAVVRPPKSWTRFVKRRSYWNRIRPLFQWQRCFNRRWMPESELHIWLEDHIEWTRRER